MARKHYTALGEQIDMNALAMRHASTIALGNARMNARGDVLDDNFVVLRTQEQIEEDYRRAKERERASLGLSRDIKAPLPQDDVTAPRAATQEKQLDADTGFEPESGTFMPTDAVDVTQLPRPTQRRRKIVDTDE